MAFLNVVQDAIGRATDAADRYSTLNRGVAILNEEQDVDAYLACYGHMHYYKLQDAMTRIDLTTIAAHPFEIWDWGCGVGLGTFSVLDRLTQVGATTSNLFRLVFVEPSFPARKRALTYLASHYPSVRHTASVHADKRSFDEVIRLGVGPTSPFALKLHLLSNVLDIPHINARMLGATIAHTFSGRNQFIILSPANGRAGHARDQFSITVREMAHSYAETDYDVLLQRNVYRLFPGPASFRLYDITRRERLITAVLK